MELVDLVRGGGYNPGSTVALGKQREEQAARRAEAVELGRSAGSPDQVEKKVRQVAEDFVSVFMNQIMKSMRATVQENSMMHGDNGEKFFQEMLDSEYSKSMAQGSGYGLTDLIYESMMTSYRVQEMPQFGSGVVNPQTDSLIREQELLQEPERTVEEVSA